MQGASSPETPAVREQAQEGHRQRRFGRLRSADPNGAQKVYGGDPVTDDVNGVLPFDSAKTFVGPNGTYYDERWRWMEWRGKIQSWNWAAACTFGVWFAYRRLHEWAILAFVWLMLLLTMGLTGSNVRLLAIAHLVAALIVGRYANMLYRQRFRRLALRAAKRQNGHGERLAALRRAGGVDRLAAWVMVVAIAVGAGMVVWQIRSSVGIEVDW